MKKTLATILATTIGLLAPFQAAAQTVGVGTGQAGSIGAVPLTDFAAGRGPAGGQLAPLGASLQAGMGLPLPVSPLLNQAAGSATTAAPRVEAEGPAAVKPVSGPAPIPAASVADATPGRQGAASSPAPAGRPIAAPAPLYKESATQGVPARDAVRPRAGRGREEAARGPPASGTEAAPEAQAPAVAGKSVLQAAGAARPEVGPEAFDGARPAAAGASPAAAEPAVAVQGKRLLVIGSLASRPFLLEESKKTAQKLGLELYLLDNPESRPLSVDIVDDAHFIPAPISSHDPKVMGSIAERMREFGGSRGLDAVITFLNPYAELAGLVVDKTGARGNTGAALAAAHTKSLAREVLSSVPEIATPYAVVAKTAEEAEASGAESARRAWREVSANGLYRVVMKPIHGGGSQLVKVGIDSEQGAVDTFREIHGGLLAFQRRPDAAFEMLDQYPGILMERMLEGPEIDVELVIQDGQVKFGHVSDNPPMTPPYAVELGVTYPSQLPEAVQAAAIAAAGKAVAALGLKFANMHVEEILTAEGPRILEVNARMGGIFVMPSILEVTGFNLIENGIRAVLGLPVLEADAPRMVLEQRLIVPRYTGVLEAIEGLDEAERILGPGRIRLFKKPGDQVLAAPDDFFDYVGYLTATGAAFDGTMDRMLEALAKVRLKIRGADGVVREQTALHQHSKVDINALYRDTRDKQAAVLASRERILQGYFRGQLGLVLSFAVYYPLFTAVMKALGGMGAVGAGRTGYAGALTVLSPLTGMLAKRLPARLILAGAFAARALIWAGLVPLSLWLLGTGPGFFAALVGLMVLDGVVVSMNHPLDIDSQGLDILAEQHGFPMDAATRNRYNARLETFWAGASFLLPPILAGAAIFAAASFASAAWALVGVMAAAFLLPAAWSVYHYLRYIPAEARIQKLQAQTLGEGAREIGRDFWSSVKKAWGIKPIRWRMGLDAFDRAIEDAVKLVLLPLFGMVAVAGTLGQNPAWGALYGTLFIAAAKVGAMIASWLVGKYWRAPAEGQANKYPNYRIFFPLGFAGLSAAAILPLAYVFFISSGMVWAGSALAAFGAFLSNGLFQAARLGYRNMKQGVVAEHGLSGPVAGISSSIDMGLSTLAILGLGTVFATLPFGAALWVTAGLFAAIGLIQLVAAPRLLFSAEERGAKK